MLKLDRFFDRLLSYLAWAAGCITVFSWASINYEVFLRYVLSRPTSWVMDFNLYFILYLTLLPAAWVLKNDGHVKVEILVNSLPRGVTRVMNTMTSIVGALICIVFFWYSMQLTLSAFHTDAVFVRSVIVPRWPIYIVIPLGFLLLFIQFLRNAYRYAMGNEAQEEA